MGIGQRRYMVVEPELLEDGLHDNVKSSAVALLADIGARTVADA